VCTASQTIDAGTVDDQADHVMHANPSAIVLPPLTPGKLTQSGNFITTLSTNRCPTKTSNARKQATMQRR